MPHYHFDIKDGHPPGHAQADFGEAIGVIGGVECKTAQAPTSIDRQSFSDSARLSQFADGGGGEFDKFHCKLGHSV